MMVSMHGKRHWSTKRNILNLSLKGHLGKFDLYASFHSPRVPPIILMEGSRSNFSFLTSCWVRMETSFMIFPHIGTGATVAYDLVCSLSQYFIGDILPYNYRFALVPNLLSFLYEPPRVSAVHRTVCLSLSGLWAMFCIASRILSSSHGVVHLPTSSLSFPQRHTWIFRPLNFLPWPLVSLRYPFIQPMCFRRTSHIREDVEQLWCQR